MNSNIKLLLFSIVIISGIYTIYQTCDYNILDRFNNKTFRTYYYKFNIIFGIFMLVFLYYKFYFN